MNVLKSILLAGGATVIMAAAAHAADLPTKKAPPAAPVANCYATFMTWLDSSAAECPLSIYGVTLYGQVDVGGGYETNAAPFNRNYPNGVQELISKQSHGGAWQGVPNGLSQSNVGLKVKEALFADVSLIGDVNFGFDPYSLQFANGPASLADNNTTKQYFQTANGDSSRAGLIDNSRAYLGFSSPTYGTLTAGRQYTFANLDSGAYDPMGGAYAFSIVSSGTLVGGTGVTETARENTSIEYVYDYNKLVHAGVLAQLGGWSAGNASQSAYQLDIGGSYAGLSVDAIYGYDKDAIALSAYGGTIPGPNNLKVTLADVNAFMLLAKYQWQALTVYGGYENATLSNPSDTNYPNGISDLMGGYSAISKDVGTTSYTIHKDLQVAWGGAKYAVLSNLDVAAAYYEAWQNNYSGAACVANSVDVSGAPKGTRQGTNTRSNNNYDNGPGKTPGKVVGNCAGTEPVIGLMIDYRPWKRVDTYAGVAFSNVTGGMAAGFVKTQNTAFTAGVRVSF